MFRTIAFRALLAVALFTTIPTATTAQDEGATPEGREWHLVRYVVDGRLRDVPGVVDASLPLEGGRVYGSAGCSGFDGDYEIDGEALTFERVGLTTDGGCPDAEAEVQAAYMAALPRTGSWAIDEYQDTGPTPIRGHNLVLYDAAGDPILEFVEPSLDQMYATLRYLSAQVIAQQQVIRNLRARIKQLEQGS